MSVTYIEADRRITVKYRNGQGAMLSHSFAPPADGCFVNEIAEDLWDHINKGNAKRVIDAYKEMGVLRDVTARHAEKLDSGEAKAPEAKMMPSQNGADVKGIEDRYAKNEGVKILDESQAPPMPASGLPKPKRGRQR